METVTIHSSRVYLGFMTGLLFLVGASGMILGFTGERLFSSLFLQIICGIMIITSGFSFYMLSFQVTFFGDMITIKQWRSKSVTAEKIRHVDFSFAAGKNGSYFIALNDGDSLYLLRRIFSYRLSAALKEFCAQNKIKTIDKTKGDQQDNDQI